jgi:hypothetical protein
MQQGNYLAVSRQPFAGETTELFVLELPLIPKSAYPCVESRRFKRELCATVRVCLRFAGSANVRGVGQSAGAVETLDDGGEL